MRVIIIGGIAAGASAAAKLKRVNKDAEVVIYEKSSIISLSFFSCSLIGLYLSICFTHSIFLPLYIKLF